MKLALCLAGLTLAAAAACSGDSGPPDVSTESGRHSLEEAVEDMLSFIRNYDGAGFFGMRTEECRARVGDSADQSDFDRASLDESLDEFFGEGFSERATLGELDILGQEGDRVRLYFSIVDRDDRSNVYLPLPVEFWAVTVGTNIQADDPILGESNRDRLIGPSPLDLGVPWQWEDGAWRLAECEASDDPNSNP